MPNRRHRNQVTPKVMKVGRVKRKFGTPENGEKGSKAMKKKYKGFSKLPEGVQRKIDPKLARKV